MKIAVHDNLPSEPTFRDQWNGLVHKMEKPQVFYTWEWAHAVSLGYPGAKPLVITGHRDGALAGVLALASENQGRAACFLSSTTADYCDFVSAPENRAEFVQGALDELRKMHFSDLRLANLPADSATVCPLTHSGSKPNFLAFTRPAYICAQVPLTNSEQRRQVRKSVHTKLRRMTNLAAGKGEFTLEHSPSYQSLLSEFPNFVTAHVGRFLQAGRTSNLLSRERREFLCALGGLLSQTGSLTLSTLKLDARTIAWNLGFRYAGSWFWYQPAFDVQLSDLSPGSYLLCNILQLACDDPGIHTVDLGLGDETYKERYARGGRQTLHVSMTDSYKTKMVAIGRYRAGQLAKTSAVAERFARACVGRGSSIRDQLKRGALLARVGKEVVAGLRNCADVRFFELPAPAVPDKDLKLQRISLALLADAAMRYECDALTQGYLVRCAQRLRDQRNSGFALLGKDGSAMHFCWTAPFDGFQLSEIKHTLREPVPECVLLFDCWTPVSQRGHGYYAACIAGVGNALLQAGKRPWIFSAAANVRSLHGIAKSGFVPRFMLRRPWLLRNAVERVDLCPEPTPKLNFHPAA